MECRSQAKVIEHFGNAGITERSEQAFIAISKPPQKPFDRSRHAVTLTPCLHWRAAKLLRSQAVAFDQGMNGIKEQNDEGNEWGCGVAGVAIGANGRGGGEGIENQREKTGRHAATG